MPLRACVCARSKKSLLCWEVFERMAASRTNRLSPLNLREEHGKGRNCQHFHVEMWEIKSGRCPKMQLKSKKIIKKKQGCLGVTWMLVCVKCKMTIDINIAF